MVNVTALKPLSSDIRWVTPESWEALEKGSPASLYLQRLNSEMGRAGIRDALNKIADIWLETIAGGSWGSLCGTKEFRKRYLLIPWHKLSRKDVLTIRGALKDTLNTKGGLPAPATVNRDLAALRGVLKECWRDGLLSSDKYERLRDFELVKGERLLSGRALSRTELSALLHTSNDSTVRGVRNTALLAVLYATGMRRSEVVSLSLKDWDPQIGSLKVRGKGNKERLVYVHNRTREHLEDWLILRGTGSGEEPLFPALEDFNNPVPSKRRMSPHTITAALEAMARKAGVKAFTPHDLRRSFVSDSISRGVDISTVQKIAGHAQIQTTARYDRRGEEEKIKASQLVDVPC